MSDAITSDTIDFYFWMSSDWAWFGNDRLLAMSRRHGLKINYYPIDLGIVYARTGGMKLALRSQERKDYRLLEMKRFSAILNMPIVMQPKFPIVSGELSSRFVIAAQRSNIPEHDLQHAIMGARWAEDRDIEAPEVLVDTARSLGLDGEALLALANEAASKARYLEYTETAISRGVFGSPFYFFRGEGFWGQDRLDMLESTILAARAEDAASAQRIA